jgi:hypothetical protein
MQILCKQIDHVEIVAGVTDTCVTNMLTTNNYYSTEVEGVFNF